MFICFVFFVVGCSPMSSPYNYGPGYIRMWIKLFDRMMFFECLFQKRNVGKHKGDFIEIFMEFLTLDVSL